MRINGNQNHGHIERTEAAKAKGVENKSEGASKVARGSKSSEAVAVSKASKALASARAPETPDAERVAKLRAAVEAGHLAIDSKAIADAMMREER
jgi:flagellar biosynthesis anti-sigma factor FlgM